MRLHNNAFRYYTYQIKGLRTDGRSLNHSIIISTANARYSHSSLGLRYLYANLDKDIQNKTTLIEKTISDTANDIAQSWIQLNPTIIGLGIYIWNIEILQEAISILKIALPKTVIVIGGPEVSYGIDTKLYNLVDFVVELEGEVIFNKLCKQIIQGDYPKIKIQKQLALDTTKLKLPYEYYNEQDIKSRKIYVEASRGCAFKCHFCLSSLDEGIRNFDIDLFLEEIRKLYLKGARQFKFVDRTFNLDIKQSIKILNFFLNEFQEQDFFLHFEVIPDRLPNELKVYIEKFIPGVLQFEVGIQTLDKNASMLIGRRQNKKKALENLSYLRYHTNAHLHVDLIIGLPAVTLEILKTDLNTLVGIGLQEVQIGILKNLKGTPLMQHIKPFSMIFTKESPYEIISNKDIDQEQMHKLRTFHKLWDKYYNSGNFIGSMKFLFNFSNPFDEFYQYSNYVYDFFGRTYNISLDQLSEKLYLYLREEKKCDYIPTRELILIDLLKKKGRKVPSFLKDKNVKIPFINHLQDSGSKQNDKALKRQQAH